MVLIARRYETPCAARTCCRRTVHRTWENAHYAMYVIIAITPAGMNDSPPVHQLQSVSKGLTGHAGLHEIELIR